MKSFIYLDTDTVNSYIAQIDNGLKTLQTQTSQSSSSTEKQSSHFDSIKSREKSDNMVEMLVDYIRQHYEENITRNTLAEMVHFSPEYVGKTFKKQTGSSINDYVNQLRIEEAKRLLKGTDNKVIDIALMVGFENMPYFSSVFKKYTGYSPAEYKKIYG